MGATQIQVCAAALAVRDRRWEVCFYTLPGGQNRRQQPRAGTCSHPGGIKCQGRGPGDRVTETPGAGRTDKGTWRQENKQRALAISTVPGFEQPEQLVPSTPLFLAAVADASLSPVPKMVPPERTQGHPEPPRPPTKPWLNGAGVEPLTAPLAAGGSRSLPLPRGSSEPGQLLGTRSRRFVFRAWPLARSQGGTRTHLPPPLNWEVSICGWEAPLSLGVGP